LNYILKVLLIFFIHAGFLCIDSNAQCSGIDFKANTTKGCPLLIVKFSAIGTSSAAGTTFQWDFGNGFVSGADTITKAFAAQGQYNIKMLATPIGAASACPVIEKDTFITVYPVPSPVIVANPGLTICNIGTKVSFTDNTPGTISRKWIIYGIKDTSKKTNFTPPNAGQYSINLFTINTYGCQGNTLDALNVYDSVPVDIYGYFTATPTYTKAIFAPYTGNLAGNTITGYSWSFPGGIPSSSFLANPPSVIYTNVKKKYDVILTITLSSGCSYTVDRKGFVYPFLTPEFTNECTANAFKVYGDTGIEGRSGFNLSFPGGVLIEPLPIITTPFYGTLTYSKPGKYPASFIYHESGGDSITINFPYYINIIGPIADFTSKDNQLCSAGDTAHFINESDSTNAPNVKYTWYILDSLDKNLITGNNEIGPTSMYNARYEPGKAGAYGISLVATSSDGCKDSINKAAFITVIQPISNFNTQNTLQCFKTLMQFVPEPTPSEGINNYYKFKWTIHDESDPSVPDTLVTPTPTMGPTLSYIPPMLGTYDISLTVSNGHCSALKVKKAAFTVVGDSTALFVSKYNGCLSPDFTITAQTATEHIYPNDPNNPPVYQWSASPATGVSFSNPNSPKTDVTFTLPDCYNIYLTITTTVGTFVCKDVYPADSQICVGAQVYYRSPPDLLRPLGCLGDVVHFINTSDISNGVYGFKWSVMPPGSADILPSDSSLSVNIVFNADTCYSVFLSGSRKIPGQTCTNTWTETGFCYSRLLPDFYTTTPTLYCAPAVATFKSSTKNAVSFMWYFGDGDSLFVGDTSTVYHVYQKFTRGDYDVSLIAYDKNGCPSSKITKKAFINITGPVPLFTVDKSVGCDSVYVNFTNTSKNVNKFYFLYDDNSPIDSVSLAPHKYVLDPVQDSVIYYPTLLSRDDPSCHTFIQDTIKLYRVPSDAKITHGRASGCAPLTVQFQALSKISNGWKWDFYGDGKIEDSVDQNPAFTFARGGKFVARLTVSNHGQCPYTVYSDTISVEANASPGFIPSRKTFCGEQTITFKNTTKNAVKYVFNYGDGSPGDSNFISPHNYYFHPLVDTGDVVYYTPTLIAYDADGCHDSVTDTIACFEKPVPGFKNSNVYGCSPLTLTFTDTSQNGFSANWDFENNGTIDTTGKTVDWVYPPGIYTVKMFSISPHGCVDSVMKVNLVTSNPLPAVDFSVADSDACLKVPVTFNNLTGKTDSIVKWQWDFDDPGTHSDTSSEKDPSYTFTKPGKHVITLEATDSKGCPNTISKNAVNVESPVTPPTANISYVTVLNQDSVQIAWNKSNINRFGSYIINQLTNSGKLVLNTVNNQDNTVFIFHDSDVNTSDSSYCFSIQVLDHCENISFGSFEHCTILLNGTYNPQTDNTLNWSGYVGWIPDWYQIYRAGNNGVYKLIDSVKGNVLSYSDTILCDENYCYFVRAANDSLGYISNSNKICINSHYVDQSVPLYMHYATVVNNNMVKLQWDSSAIKGLIGYQVGRYLPGVGWNDNYAFSEFNTYNDAAPKTNDSSYIYRVRTIDKCGYTSPESNIGTSILLKHAINNDNISLTWTGYKNWAGGVQNYLVQVQLKNKQYKTIATLSASDTTYTDDSVYNAIDTAYCYRVIAIENGGRQDSSISNVSCAVLPSRIFIPNAFSPNGDSLNDVWKVSALSVYNIVGSQLKGFDAKVYNRWGTLVFESKDINKGWDGKFNGALVPTDIYIYLISAEGIDGKYLEFSGNITLIR